jgi:hypothetical protein
MIAERMIVERMFDLKTERRYSRLMIRIWAGTPAEGLSSDDDW